MSHAGFVIAGWGTTVVAVVAYAVAVIRKGRALSAMVAPEDRRWSE